MKRRSFSNSSLPAAIINLLRVVKGKLLSRGVSDVRIFGSIAQGAEQPRDIDIGILCDESRWAIVAADLQQDFPAARIDLGDYTRTATPPTGDLALHFVLASPRTIQEKPRLGMAFQQGFSLA